MNDFGIDIWSNNNFIIEEGKLKLNYKSKPSLISLVNSIRKKDYKGPLLFRFPHLIEKQIDRLYDTYTKAIKEYSYKGSFNAVFPLKVNQYLLL